MRSIIKRLFARPLEASLSLFTSTRWGRAYFDQELLRLLENSPRYQQKNWQITDKIYSASRRNLIGNPHWILGSLRVTDVVSKYFQYLGKHNIRTDLPFLDLGCGTIHPYGVSTLFYLNGWDECWALDINPCDKRRATEALADLIRDVIAHPGDFAFATDADTVLQRARKFNLRALDNGDIGAGLGNISIHYHISDIAGLPALSGGLRFGTMCSHTVWEHFREFDIALKTIREVCAPGGVHYHYIDFADHRCYTEPDKYDFWSFLTSPRDAFDPLCNKIRCSEMLEYIKAAGFEILAWEPEDHDYPETLRDRLHQDWKHLSDDDLKAVRVSCVLRS